MSSLLVTGARILGGRPADLLIRGGIIVEMGSLPGTRADAVLDADGLVALPGLVDLHTHLREPGREVAETVSTGTRAAAGGGYTAVHAMANTDPVADTPQRVEHVYDLGRRDGHCDVMPVGAVTLGLAGTEIADLEGMAQSRARVRIFSDDGRCVSDPVIMRSALVRATALDGVVAQHAQDQDLAGVGQANAGEAARLLGVQPWPSVGEEVIVARDCLLARDAGARLHVCHVSTAGTVDVIRWAKQRGIRVTAEVTPHHLMLTDARTAEADTRFKVNPPLRSREDVVALRAALADGTIDVVATDHAPHPMVDKAQEWTAAPVGMTGLETALAVVAEVMLSGGAMSWGDIAACMSHRPAAIAGIAHLHGRQLEVGAPANLCLVDSGGNWVVDPDKRFSRSGNTPFAGHRFSHRVVATILRGTISHQQVATSST
ncbi:dihydroorotase [Phytohabitans kaempferiae]|uniref:Dihydroorotase n=1 Tax=Phytohabitans kaempferiae TaxID=1620943 RepID=A0ABV6MA97_9ACTN